MGSFHLCTGVCQGGNSIETLLHRLWPKILDAILALIFKVWNTCSFAIRWLNKAESGTMTVSGT